MLSKKQDTFLEIYSLQDVPVRERIAQNCVYMCDDTYARL